MATWASSNQGKKQRVLEAAEEETAQSPTRSRRRLSTPLCRFWKWIGNS